MCLDGPINVALIPLCRSINVPSTITTTTSLLQLQNNSDISPSFIVITSPSSKGSKMSQKATKAASNAISIHKVGNIL